MIISLIIAYLFLSGGHETFLLNPNMAKNVSTYVKDKANKEKIDKIIKSVAKNQEVFEKKTKKAYDKKLVALNMDSSSTIASFNAEYDKFYSDLKNLQESYIDSELVVKSLIKPTEWDSIMKKVLVTPTKDKAQKEFAKQNLDLRNRLIKTCNRAITNASDQQKAKQYVDEYTAKGDSVASSFLDLNYKDLKNIRSYSATRADFEQDRKKMIQLRKNFTDYLVAMRFRLITITPKDHWTELAKELNNSFSYMGPGL
jgi:hypothetical protein